VKLCLLALAAVAAACTPASAAPLKAVPTAVVAGNTAFALDLYGKVRSEPGNLFMSPASISTALSMTWAGARGDTAKQMTKVLHFDLPEQQQHEGQAALLARLSSSSPNSPQLAIANRIWSQKDMSLEAPFVKLTNEQYGAGIELVDFVGKPNDARLTINQWVKKKTNDKIVDLLAPGVINPLTRMVLTNAIWFKGSWATAFPKANTKDLAFATSAGSKKVPTMQQVLRTRHATTADAQLLELPYKSSDPDRALSMVIVLPKAKDGLNKVEATLNSASLDSMIKSLAPMKVDVALPRFSTTKSFELKDTLSSMGMPLAFTEGVADFSGINKKGGLYISKVVHKAFVDVNEEGTEAAAATAVIVATESAAVEPPPVAFRADHPFVFFIRDNQTGTILFMGRVADPA